MVLPELKALAATMGISGTGAMRKGDLIAAIQSGTHVRAAATKWRCGHLNGGAAANGAARTRGLPAAVPPAVPRLHRDAAPDAAADVPPSFERSLQRRQLQRLTITLRARVRGAQNAATESPRQGGDYVARSGRTAPIAGF